MLGLLLRDVRYSIRLLGKAPGFSVTVVLALALGIGANCTIFSIVNAALLNTLSCDSPQQLMVLDEALPSLSGDLLSASDILDWKDRLRTFSDLAAYSLQNGGLNLTGKVEPERVEGTEVSTNFFSTFQVNAIRGRTFNPEEQQPGKNRVAVLSYALWQRAFGSAPDILDQTISLNGISFTVVGIMPPDFRFPSKAELWIPISLGRDRIFTGWGIGYEVIGRLKPGVKVEQAQSDIAAFEERLAMERPDSWGAVRKIKIIPLLDQIVSNVRLSLLVLSGAVGLVLLIACANVTNLLLVRAGTRQKEIAIRAALGASRLRLIRQLLVESLLLAFLGGAVGLLGAYWLLKFLVALGPTGIPRLSEVRLDNKVIAFTSIVCLLTGILAGLAPALQTLRTDLNLSLKESTPSLIGATGHHRMKSSFVIAEIALALLLLIGAGLLIKSLSQLQQVSPGFNASNAITVSLSLPRVKYANGVQTTDFYQRLMERLRTIPGIQAVGAINTLPFGKTVTISFLFDVVGQPYTGKVEDKFASDIVVTPDYFKAMGIPLLQGRVFTEQDTKGSLKVIIISESLARRYWSGENALGKQLEIADESQPAEIIGVVGDVKHFGLESKYSQAMYTPYLQTTPSLTTLVLRFNSDPSAMVGAIRNEVKALDSDLPVYDIKTMDQWLDESMAQRSFITFALGIFALIALALAVSGIYSIMAYTVSQRRREIGIRMALGARRGHILKLILGNGLSLAVAGTIIGLASAIALTRLMSSLLYNIQPIDPLIFTLTALGLIGVALLASLIQAYEATRVDPMIAIRHE